MSEQRPVPVDRVSNSSGNPSSRLDREPAVDVALEAPQKEKPAASSPDDAVSTAASLEAVAVPAAHPRQPEPSASSLRPVGIDVPPPQAGFADLVLGPPAVARHPRVALVVGSLVVCSLILVAAGVRVAQRNARARSTATASTAAAAGAPVPAPAAVDPGGQGKAPPPSGNPSSPETPAVWSNSFPGTEPVRPAVAVPPASPTTGTLRLRRPAQPGSVWLDGTRLNATSTVVTCGLHQIRVGARSRTRELTVPCGAEVSIAR